jgi:hypothetical protein
MILLKDYNVNIMDIIPYEPESFYVALPDFFDIVPDFTVYLCLISDSVITA